MKKTGQKAWIGLVVLLFVFAASLLLARTYEEEIQLLVGQTGTSGMLIYVVIFIISVVVAPLNSFAVLLPIAVTVWGPFTTALLNIIGWSLGGIAAYWVARRFGYPVVEKFIDLKKYEHIQQAVPKQHLFLWLVVARMTVPVEVLSYALGLFTTIPYRTHALTTVIGVAPFSFIFAYTVSLPIEYLFFVALLAALAIGTAIWWMRKNMPDQEAPSE